jgi:DNA-binding NarL/FixJ family response regulator
VITRAGEAHPWAAEIGLKRDDLLLLDCLAQGMDDVAIGRRLHLSETGVKSRVLRLRPRLGAENRCHLVAIAMTMGLIRLDTFSGAPLNSAK